MGRFLNIVMFLAVTSGAVLGGIDPDGSIFRRGDANSSGTVDVTDGVFINGWLFNGGNEPPCLNQADVNHDGAITVTDSSYLFNWLFLGGPQPPAPGPHATNCSTTSPFVGCAQSPCN